MVYLPRLDGRHHWADPTGVRPATVTDATLYWKGPLRGCNLYRKCTEKIAKFFRMSFQDFLNLEIHSVRGIKKVPPSPLQKKWNG